VGNFETLKTSFKPEQKFGDPDAEVFPAIIFPEYE
jgi:hypothetical protein